MSTDERTVNIVNNRNNLTVVCGDVESHCILNYESNKTLKNVIFELNTTTNFSLKGIESSSTRLLEISPYLNSTQFIWYFNNTGMLLMQSEGFLLHTKKRTLL